MPLHKVHLLSLLSSHVLTSSLNEFLPPGSFQNQQIDAILEEHKKLSHMTEIEAKCHYVHLIRSLSLFPLILGNDLAEPLDAFSSIIPILSSNDGEQRVIMGAALVALESSQRLLDASKSRLSVSRDIGKKIQMRSVTANLEKARDDFYHCVKDAKMWNLHKVGEFEKMQSTTSVLECTVYEFVSIASTLPSPKLEVEFPFDPFAPLDTIFHSISDSPTFRDRSEFTTLAHFACDIHFNTQNYLSFISYKQDRVAIKIPALSVADQIGRYTPVLEDESKVHPIAGRILSDIMGALSIINEPPQIYKKEKKKFLEDLRREHGYVSFPFSKRVEISGRVGKSIERHLQLCNKYCIVLNFNMEDQTEMHLVEAARLIKAVCNALRYAGDMEERSNSEILLFDCAKILSEASSRLVIQAAKLQNEKPKEELAFVKSLYAEEQKRDDRLLISIGNSLAGSIQFLGKMINEGKEAKLSLATDLIEIATTRFLSEIEEKSFKLESMASVVRKQICVLRDMVTEKKKWAKKLQSCCVTNIAARVIMLGGKEGLSLPNEMLWHILSLLSPAILSGAEMERIISFSSNWRTLGNEKRAGFLKKVIFGEVFSDILRIWNFSGHYLLVPPSLRYS